jgi:hypothetical protein
MRAFMKITKKIGTSEAQPTMQASYSLALYIHAWIQNVSVRRVFMHACKYVKAGCVYHVFTHACMQHI